MTEVLYFCITLYINEFFRLPINYHQYGWRRIYCHTYYAQDVV